MSVKTLNEFETVRIEFPGRQEYMEISGNGTVKYDMVTHGSEINLFNDRQSAGWTSGNHRKLENITMYLSLLYEAQRSNHDVHKEIHEALTQYKTEAGI